MAAPPTLDAWRRHVNFCLGDLPDRMTRFEPMQEARRWRQVRDMGTVRPEVSRKRLERTRRVPLPSQHDVIHTDHKSCSVEST